MTGRAAAEQLVGERLTDGHALFWHTSVWSLGLPKDVDGMVRGRGLETVRQVVMGEVPEEAEATVRLALMRRSGEFRIALSRSQLFALQEFSGSRVFVFCPRGMLWHVPEPGISELGLSPARTRRLLEAGYDTVESIHLATDEELQDIRSVGLRAIAQVRQAERQYLQSERVLERKLAQRMRRPLPPVVLNGAQIALEQLDADGDADHMPPIYEDMVLQAMARMAWLAYGEAWDAHSYAKEICRLVRRFDDAREERSPPGPK